MHSPPKDTKKHRRVSFNLPNSPNTTKARQSPHPSIRPPKPTVNDYVDDNNNGSKDKNAATCPTPPETPAPPATSTAAHPTPQPSAPAPVDPLAHVFTHSVTNTPHGLVIDGVLQPRGAAVHSELRDTHSQPQPQFFPGRPYNPAFPPNFPPNFPAGAQPQQANNMSTVGAGFMPDPNAVHYQPPVPDTTNGPFEYTYMPRSDPAMPQYMMAQGAAGGPPWCAPGAFPYQQPQPGMATAPIPMMAAGGQPPFMQAQHMQYQPVGFQPGAMPPMACGPPPGGPTYVATGVAQPAAPPNAYYGGPGVGGIEMGKTRAEVEAENQYSSLHNQMNEPQGIKPADDDISRMYWCRELDGQWINRSRFSLDRMGNFRWYVTDAGVFYAKMLPE